MSGGKTLKMNHKVQESNGGTPDEKADPRRSRRNWYELKERLATFMHCCGYCLDICAHYMIKLIKLESIESPLYQSSDVKIYKDLVRPQHLTSIGGNKTVF